MFVCDPYLSPQGAQGRRRVVPDLAPAIDLRAYLSLDLAQIGDQRSQLSHDRSDVAGPRNRRSRSAVYFERVRHRQQLAPGQHAAQTGAGYGLRRVGLGIEGQVVDLVQERASVRGLLLESVNLEGVERGNQLQRQAPGPVERGLVRQPTAYLIEV